MSDPVESRNSHLPELVPVPRLEHPLSRFSLSPEQWLLINNRLGRDQYYPFDSKVAQKVQSLYDGIQDDQRMPVLVMHSDKPNAFASSGFTVVTDGLLRLLDHDEEVEGILAHEHTHQVEGHRDEINNSEDILEETGKGRKSEIRADIVPLNTLDKKGKNPYGLISALRKLRHYVLETHSKESPDPEHGSLTDRILNPEEIAKFVDIRNLSHKMTPLGLTEEDFKACKNDEELWNNYDQLDPLAKRHFLQRQVSVLKLQMIDDKKDPIALAEIKNKYYQLMTWQKDLFIEVDPSLDSDAAANLAFMTITSSFGTKNVSEIDFNFTAWTSQFDTFEKVKDFIMLDENAVLTTLGIKTDNTDLKVMALLSSKTKCPT